MGGRCAVAVAAAVWGGLLLGRGLEGGAVVAYLAVAALLAWLAWGAPERVGTVLALLVLLLAGAARAGAARAALDRAARGLDEDAAPRWIQARADEHPLREAPEPVALVRLTRPAPPLPAGARVRLRLPAGSEAEWGDTLTALVALERPRERGNPGGPSPREIATGAGYLAQGRALAVRITPARGLDAWPRATATRWRRAIEGALARGLSAPARELVTPLVIGDRSALPPGLSADLRAAGLTHLLALSGVHVTWLAAVARGLAAALGSGVRGRAASGGACAVFYVLIAGPLPSLMRAAATELVACAARCLGRALDGRQALAVSALALLAARPAWAGDLGFQLSCAATLGLVAVAPEPGAPSGWRRALAAPVVATLAAQTAALPLLLDRFHALPWSVLVTNLLAVPVCGLLLASAWAASALECLLPGAGAPFFSACEPLAAALRGISELAGRLPLALFATGSEPAIPWLAGAGAALLAMARSGPRPLAARLRPASRSRITAALLGSLASTLALLLAASAPALRPPPGRWWLVALDAGQGDAVALAFADGWWLVDAGPRTPRFDAGESTVMPFLRWAGVRRLSALVLTHDDGDHTGGARAVLRGTRVGALIAPVALPGVPGPAARVRAPGVPIQRVARGDTLRRAPGVVVRWPPAAGDLPGDNAASLVLEVRERGGPVLLAADVDSTREDSLEIATPLAVLKVAHHGAAGSSGASFLARARPALALISCGRRNPFGHPDAGALARLAAAGAAVRRTDREGTVWLEMSAAGVLSVDWRRGAPRVRGDGRSLVAAPRVTRVALAAPARHW